MVSSRKCSRREFCANFPLLIFAALADCPPRSPYLKRKFDLNNRVITKRLCNDHRSPNFKGIDWEKGYIVGYAWNYDEWLDKKFANGWTYFICFDETNNPDYFTKPWIDFEHESQLELA